MPGTRAQWVSAGVSVTPPLARRRSVTPRDRRLSVGLQLLEIRDQRVGLRLGEGVSGGPHDG